MSKLHKKRLDLSCIITKILGGDSETCNAPEDKTLWRVLHCYLRCMKGFSEHWTTNSCIFWKSDISYPIYTIIIQTRGCTHSTVLIPDHSPSPLMLLNWQQCFPQYRIEISQLFQSKLTKYEIYSMDNMIIQHAYNAINFQTIKEL